MGASSRSSNRAELTRASSSESVASILTVGNASNAQSSSSTPPTSVGDSISVSSASLKLDDPQSAAEAAAGRSRRARTSVGTYNVKVLSGTAIHAPKKFLKNNEETGNELRRRTISGDTLVDKLASNNTSSETVEKDANRLVRDGINALNLEWSVDEVPKSRSQIGLTDSPKKNAKPLDVSRRRSTRSAGENLESLTRKLSTLGKRGRNKFEGGLAKAKRELRNLADTPEYAHIDTKPVVHEVWSNGKLVKEEPPKKKKKIEEASPAKPKPEEPKLVEAKKPVGKREKVWLSKGLYAGQEPSDKDWFSNYTAKEKETMTLPTFKPNGVLPMPMWHGQRLLHVGRDFKLPFDICSPLPPGQPKPDEWRKTSSSKCSLYKCVCDRKR